PQIVDQWRVDTRAQAATRRAARHTADAPVAAAPPTVSPPPMTAVAPGRATPVAGDAPTLPPPGGDGSESARRAPWRPTANHPWRQQRFGKARQEQLAC